MRQSANMIFLALAFGDVGKQADIAGHAAAGFGDSNNGKPLGIEFARLAAVDDLARPASGAGQGVPHVAIKRIIVLAGGNHRRCPAHCFIRAIPADFAERRIDRQNAALGIGHHHAFAGRFECQSGQTQIAQAPGIAQAFADRILQQMHIKRLQYVTVNADIERLPQMAGFG